MVTLGRLTATIGVGGSVILFAVLAGAGAQDGTPLGNALGWLGGIASLMMVVTWFLAIWHWGTRYPADRPGKNVWGLVAVLGFVLGAGAYWFWAVGKPTQSRFDKPSG